MDSSCIIFLVDQVEKPDETVVDKEVQETPAADAAAAATSGAIVEEEAVVATPHATKEAAAHKEHKDNVIDTIKKGPLGKFFNKKEKKEEAKEEHHAAAAETTAEAAAPVVADEHTVEPAATAEPVAETAAGKFNKPSTLYHFFMNYEWKHMWTCVTCVPFVYRTCLLSCFLTIPSFIYMYNSNSIIVINF